MNSDDEDTPNRRVPMPVASPNHPTIPRRSTTKEVALDAILRSAKKAERRKPLNYTLIGTIVTALTVGVVTGIKKTSDTKDTALSTEFRLDSLQKDVDRLKRRFERFKARVPVGEQPDPPEDRDVNH